jgi:hypothetical protein
MLALVPLASLVAEDSLVVVSDMLCSKNLICKQWQSVIAKHKLILSSSTDKPLTTTKLSSATSDAKSTNASIYEAIRKKVQEIADCGKNDSKDTI